MSNPLKELVEVTRLIKEAESRKNELKAEVTQFLLENKSKTVNLEGGARITLQQRSYPIKKQNWDERADELRCKKHASEIYHLQKTSFMANLNAILLSTNDDKRIPPRSAEKDSLPKKPVLTVRL